eukprot:TRINITY_DN33900_c0_g2_i1.p2 TRINITY_DN33900_c0_g2~~TRINITY_DN33900_c0_g2_i1.p2  ORF type:complete len:111 (+),score=14.88 TRINITY_DN33900_c0_g2_i1:190-522(+)
MSVSIATSVTRPSTPHGGVERSVKGEGHWPLQVAAKLRSMSRTRKRRKEVLCLKQAGQMSLPASTNDAQRRGYAGNRTTSYRQDVVRDMEFYRRSFEVVGWLSQRVRSLS